MSIARVCAELEARVGANSLAEAASLVEHLERLFLRLEGALAKSKVAPISP
jgi:hypothetical protein